MCENQLIIDSIFYGRGRLLPFKVLYYSYATRNQFLHVHFYCISIGSK